MHPDYIQTVSEPQAVGRTPVTLLLEHLDMRVDYLHDVISSLESRIQPALGTTRPTAVSEKPTDQDSAGTSPVVERLEATIGRVTHCIDRIQTMTDRVEL